MTTLTFPENNDLLSVQLFTELVSLEYCEGQTESVKNSSMMKQPFHLTAGGLNELIFKKHIGFLGSRLLRYLNSSSCGTSSGCSRH